MESALSPPPRPSKPSRWEALQSRPTCSTCLHSHISTHPPQATSVPQAAVRSASLSDQPSPPPPTYQAIHASERSSLIAQRPTPNIQRRNDDPSPITQPRASHAANAAQHRTRLDDIKALPHAGSARSKAAFGRVISYKNAFGRVRCNRRQQHSARPHASSARFHPAVSLHFTQEGRRMPAL